MASFLRIGTPYWWSVRLPPATVKGRYSFLLCAFGIFKTPEKDKTELDISKYKLNKKIFKILDFLFQPKFFLLLL